MFVLVTDYTLRKIMSANDQGIFAVTGRAHCQRQVASFNRFGSVWKPYLRAYKAGVEITDCPPVREGKDCSGHVNILDTFPKERLKLCLFSLVHIFGSQGQAKTAVDR